MLTLPEELLLLRAAAGGVLPPTAASERLAANKLLTAGRLMELVLAKRLAVEFHRRRLLMSDAVALRDAAPTRDPLLDAVLERVAASDSHSCSYWIKRTAKGAQAAYWDRLVGKGLLRPDRLSRHAPQQAVDAGTLAALVERIRSVLTQPEGSDVRMGDDGCWCH